MVIDVSKLINTAVKHKLNVHRYVAAYLFSVGYNKVTVEQYKAAKQVNYFHCYSFPVQKLSERLNIHINDKGNFK